MTTADWRQHTQARRRLAELPSDMPQETGANVFKVALERAYWLILRAFRLPAYTPICGFAAPRSIVSPATKVNIVIRCLLA